VFNYVNVQFPNSTAGPSHVYTLSLHQARYQHEIAIIKFRDGNVLFDAVSTGSPITFTVTSGISTKEFKGYVHSVHPDTSPSHNLTEVIAVSASSVMKNPSQKVYKNLSADAIINQIVSKYRFNGYLTPHPRIYPQVAQAGHTDWELAVNLAKKSGYSLRTEGTEIYLQPVLAEYTSKRSQASKFVMRDASHPNGSTLYSFDANISENNSYDGDLKAAIAISGLDTATQKPISITKQIRGRTTRTKAKPEAFDKYATDVVATDAATAAYEADAAEQRATFPYRATAVVLGDASLRPDLPVYLDGIGDYSGYWVILGTEHIVEEKARNEFMYTTKLTLGTDSLGDASTWIDGQTITTPKATSTRTLIPGVRQTNVQPTSSLLSTSPFIGPQSTGNFSQAKNRPPQLTNSRVVSAPTWVAKPAPPPVSPPTSQSFPNRILSKKVPNL
jgi:phage protein D